MDLAAYLRILRRRWLALAACLIAGVVGAIAVTRSTPKAYTSTARLFIDIPAAQGISDALQGVQLSAQLIQSYASIASSATVTRQVATQLHASEPLHLSVQPVQNTLIIQVTATQSDPALARDVANADAAALIADVSQFEQAKTAPVVARVIDSGTVDPTPVQPKPVTNLLLGGFLGLVMGLGTIVVIETLDRSIRSPEEAAAILEAPILGLVPRRRSRQANELGERAGAASYEAFRALRTSVRFLAIDRPIRSLVISSPGPGDGKTTVAANLAVAMAEVGERVILVDADLRHPGVAERFGIASEPGLTSVLIDQVQLPDAIRRITPRLAILPSGPPPPNPAELLGSEAASGVFAYLRANADIVIIDAPPLLAVTDAVVLATYADAIAMVARLGRTTRDTTVEARRRLDVVNARIAGCIVNCTNPGETYGSRYRYPGPLRKERSKARRDDDPRRDAHLVEPDKDSVVDEPALP